MWKASHLKGFTAAICKVQQPLSSAASFFPSKRCIDFDTSHILSCQSHLIIKCRKHLITRELHTAAASIISCRDEIGSSAVELGPLWEKHNRNTGSVNVIQV